MNKTDFSRFTKKVGMKMSQHSPEILTGIGVAGMISSTVLAVRATPKALVLIQDAKDEKQDDLTPVETVKVAWKPYIPAAVTGAASVACLIGAGSVNARRTAALATAYKLSETALTEYRDKVTETIGEKKEKEIRKQVARDRLEKTQVNPKTVIVSGKGDTLFIDPIGGREFRASVDAIKKAEIHLNKRVTQEWYASLNDFYCELGLPSTKTGGDLGWKQDDGYVDIDFYPDSKDDEPCFVLDYSVAPKYDYSKFA